MAIVYQHIKKDTLEVFYIGIGKTKYRKDRKTGRNKLWYNIVNKHGYESQILFENITWEEACLHEKNLISKYGRIDLGTGILANMTDGGEGTVGCIISETNKKLFSNLFKGKKRPSEVGTKISNTKKGKKLTIQHRLSLSNSQKEINNQPPSRKGILHDDEKCKKISQFTKEGDLIKTWRSLYDIKETTNLNISNIIQVCKGKRKTVGGYLWKYE